jgi:hypothetical protein
LEEQQMIEFYLNAALVLALLVATAAALVVIAFSRPPRERMIVVRRKRVSLQPSRPLSARGSGARHRRVA